MLLCARSASRCLSAASIVTLCRNDKIGYVEREKPSVAVVA
jgi:hypothetical protein